MLGKVLFASVTGLTAHTGVIYYRNAAHHSALDQQIANETATSTPPEWRTGGVDDQIKDGLQSGDLLLIRRKWHLQYLPVGLYVLWYRWLTGSDSDHLGVIVKDQYGEPFVAESNPFGVSIRSYKLRVRHAQSEHVLLHRLIPGQRGPSLDPLLAAPAPSAEASSFMRFFVQSALPSSQPLLCPNLSFAQTVLATMGIALQARNEQKRGVLSLSSITDGQVKLVNAAGKELTVSATPAVVRIN